MFLIVCRCSLVVGLVVLVRLLVVLVGVYCSVLIVCRVVCVRSLVWCRGCCDGIGWFLWWLFCCC